MKVVILGATSHIAKSLIPFFSKDHELYLFSRQQFRNYTEFNNYKYDMIINCVGVGTTPRLSDYFTTTEAYDNMILCYLKTVNPEALYISFSSGSVHNYRDTVDIKPENYNAISKLYSEAKHRSFDKLNIIDIRLYSYFSQYANLEKDKYLLNEMVSCVINKKVFVTSHKNILRDYIAPSDLYSFIVNCKPGNRAYEVGSKFYVTKKELLHFFKSTYGLEYQINPSHYMQGATGDKLSYIPEKIDNTPELTSMESLTLEVNKILKLPLDKQNAC